MKCIMFLIIIILLYYNAFSYVKKIHCKRLKRTPWLIPETGIAAFQFAYFLFLLEVCSAATLASHQGDISDVYSPHNCVS